MRLITNRIRTKEKRKEDDRGRAIERWVPIALPIRVFVLCTTMRSKIISWRKRSQSSTYGKFSVLLQRGG